MILGIILAMLNNVPNHVEHKGEDGETGYFKVIKSGGLTCRLEWQILPRSFGI